MKKLFLLLALALPGFAYSEKIVVRYDFEEKPAEGICRGWAVEPQQVDRVVEEGTDNHVMRFRGKGWNTAIFSFRPGVRVTEYSALRFRVKVSRPGGWKLLFSNSTEGAEYALHCIIEEKNKWTEVMVPLQYARYQRFGRDGAVINGIVGDELTSVQLAYLGEEMLVDDVEIFEMSPEALEALGPAFPEIDAYIRENADNIPECSNIQRNGIFPFGFIITQNGHHANGEMFGQKLEDLYRDDLLNMRMAGFNAVSNFCSRMSAGEHLELMEECNMYLLDTSTARSNLNTFKDDDPVLAGVRKYSSHPNLLAWYGRDEPTDFKQYLECKKRVEDAAGGKAFYTSAMHMPSAIPLAPAMDVVTIDPYSLMEAFDPERSAATLRRHSIYVDSVKEISRGKRVWAILQGFSRRDNNARLQRYPRPEEVRFDVLNCVASGVSGIFFFIANDTVSYLDRKYRVQEFDQTAFDAWGNGSRTTEEMSALARRLIPLMPSFLDMRPAKALPVESSSSRMIVRQWENELGTLIFCVNSNLADTESAELNISLEPGCALYDLESSAVSSSGNISVTLAPGDARIMLAASEDGFRQASREISSRRAAEYRSELETSARVLADAGFDTAEIAGRIAAADTAAEGFDDGVFGELDAIAAELEALRASNPDYCRAAELLGDVKEKFGMINAALSATGVIEHVDSNPDWNDIFDRITEASGRYFSCYRQWQKGGKIDMEALKLLDGETFIIYNDVSDRLKEKNIKLKPEWNL